MSAGLAIAMILLVALAAAAVAWLAREPAVRALHAALARAETQAGEGRRELEALRTELAGTQSGRRELDAALLEARSGLAAAQADAASLRQQLAGQRDWVAEQSLLFEKKVLAAAAQVMEERGRALGEQSRLQVETVVGPVREQLQAFRARVDAIYAAENTERGALREQIVQLTRLNQTVSAQADKLARALTVSSKSTGDWGEMILERILEDSGLRRGHEYDLQVSITGLDGREQRPDALIRLPEGRQLVVDAKVSNKAWTEYCDASEAEAREELLDAHLFSLRQHVKALAARDYARSPDLHTVEFVLLFVPVEAALLTALAAAPDLYTDAYRNRIILVSPSTLLAVIKLVEGMWTVQKRKESADEIAEAGRRLYEKLCGFAHSFVEVGEAITRAQDVFQKARGQLATGRGNAITLAQRMIELGVSPAAGKTLPSSLLGSEAAEE